MDENLKQILKEFEELKGQFILTQSHKLARLVAIATDEDDYYWVTYNGRQLEFSTCVGSIIPLKGYLRDEDYQTFLQMAKLNHLDQPNYYLPRTEKEKETRIEANILHKETLEKLTEPDKFLSEVCWDLK